jgi:hypothetical protein
LRAAYGIDSAMESGNVSHLDRYMEPNVIDHAQGDVNYFKGLGKVKEEIAETKGLADGDFKIKIQKSVADTDYVFQWLEVSGTDYAGAIVDPGQHFEIPWVCVYKFKDGKASDWWVYWRAGDVAMMVRRPPPLPNPIRR